MFGVTFDVKVSIQDSADCTDPGEICQVRLDRSDWEIGQVDIQ